MILYRNFDCNPHITRFLKKLAYSNGFPFSLPLACLLACLWPAFWPAFWPTLGHTCCISWKGTCYSTGTGTLVTVLSHRKRPFFNWKEWRRCGKLTLRSLQKTSERSLKCQHWVNMMNGGQTGFSVLIGGYLSLTGVILSEKSFHIIDIL